jgi:hypothetical protein
MNVLRITKSKYNGGITMSKIKAINELLKCEEVEGYLGFKVEITALNKDGFIHPYGLRSDHGGVYFTGTYTKVITAANKILKDSLVYEINKITRKVMCHDHKALKGKSIEWLQRELIYTKESYK